MRCPACGHENNDLATRCSACGSMLQGSGFWSQQTNPEPDDSPKAPDDAPVSRKFAAGPVSVRRRHTPDADTQQAAEEIQEDTAKRLYVPVEEHEDDQPAAAPGEVDGGGTAEHPQGMPQLKRDHQAHDAAGTGGQQAPAKGKRLGEFLRKHQRALGVSIAIIVVATMGVVWLVTTLTNAPSHAQIASDISARIPSYTYSGGAFGPDLEIPLSNAAVTSCTATQTPEGMQVSDGVGSSAYGVTAEVTYDDGRIRVVRNVSATYVRTDDGWALGGELADQGTSFTALAGIDESKVLTTMEPILSSADSAGGSALAQIYGQGEFNIVGNNFVQTPEMDTSTDDVTIHCASYGTFYSYEGDVTAHFAFESGEWRLRSAEADQSASTRSYLPLLGTWSGTMVSHNSTDGSCYGARGMELVLTIDSFNDVVNNQASVEGTISCLAHFHGRVNSDLRLSEGDEYLQNESFTGALSDTSRASTGGLNLEGTTSSFSNGDVSFVVTFGTDDDPTAAIARVTTTYEYDELVLMLIPHKTTSRYTDTYLLTHV